MVRKTETERATRLITVHLISLTPLNLCLSHSPRAGEMQPGDFTLAALQQACGNHSCTVTGRNQLKLATKPHSSVA